MDNSNPTVPKNSGEFTIVLSTQEFIYANVDFLKMCGFTLEELLKLRYDQIVHPDDYDNLMDNIQKQIGNVKILKGFHRAVRKDKSVFTVFCHGYLTEDKFGKVFMHCVFADVTYYENAINKAAQTESQLIETKKQILLQHKQNLYILDSIPISVYVVDKKSKKLLYCNSQIIKASKNPSAATCHEMLNNLEIVCPHCPVSLMVDGGPLNTIIDDRLTGIPLDISAIEIMWEENQPAYLIAVKKHLNTAAEDIEKNKQELLDKRYSFIFSNNSDYIIDIDTKDWTYVGRKINSDCCLSFNKSGTYSQLLITLLSYVYPTQKNSVAIDLSINSLKELFNSEQNDMKRLYMLSTDKGIQWVEMSVFCIKDAEDPAIVISILDITEKKQQAEKDIISKKYVNMAIEKVYDLVLAANATQHTYEILYKNPNIIGNISKNGTIDNFIHIMQTFVAPEDIERVKESALSVGFKNSTKTHSKFNYRLHCADSKVHWMSSETQLVENQFDSDILTITMVKCIDSQKAFEEQLINTTMEATSANKAKTDFLSHMSHENPYSDECNSRIYPACTESSRFALCCGMP